MTKNLLSLRESAPILSKCPHCGKCNPEVKALTMGESSDATMIGFVPSCCLKIIGVQMCAKAQPETIQ